MKEPNLQRISKALENYCHWIVKQNLCKVVEKKIQWQNDYSYEP